MARRAWWPLGPAAVVLACALGACGAPTVRYVSNSTGGLFLKVPHAWGVFPVSDGNVAPSPSQMPGEWKVIVDGADAPSRGHAEDAVPEAPVGIVEVTPTALFQDPTKLASNAGLRSLMLASGTDPFETAQTDPSVKILDYSEVDDGQGYWGNHMTVKLQIGADEAETVTQYAYANDSFTRIYVLRLYCSSDCYDTSKREIQSVLDSWTLR
jgi:hypothetical protein